ncbi:MAG: hypothetical protein G01um10143_13 [Parcubacteria group bacterium Gr01-1014_3]|nr:MAG: hypothetical protein G01um10143_13 [Parcubacteria group bacterium Gr01-1014_3]
MEQNRSACFVAISGIDFPKRSRKYLMNLTAEVAKSRGANFILIAGHVVNGRELDKQLKLRLKGVKKTADKSKEEMCKKIEQEFVNEMAGALNEFLPVIKDVNYHIVVAEAIYDWPIGYKVLEVVQKMRGGPQGDIRLFNDPEHKMPVQLPGFGDVRVLVPKKQPWFYENVTGVMQRVINGFAMRTNSPPPPLIIVGCTGTGAFVPRYRGIPCIAIPCHNKLDEQLSAENMVGCTVVTIAKDEKVYRITWDPIDYRTVIFNERELAIPEDMSKAHRRVIRALEPSSASFKTIEFRVNSNGNGHRKTPWSAEKVKKILEELQKRHLVEYNKAQNRYAINDALVNKVNVSLEDFFKNKKTVTFVQKSCWHVGALKALYWSVLHYEPKLARDVDAIVICGDIQQGISHNYEYNGELLPIANGPDKQELLAGLMQTQIMMETFVDRWEDFRKLKLPTAEMVKKCTVGLVIKEGNHDESRFSSGKGAIILMIFEMVLRYEMAKRVNQFLQDHKVNDLTYSQVAEIVNAKIIRVGETSVAEVNGIPIGLKHPHQGKTQAKGARIQQTNNFFMQAFRNHPDPKLRNIAVVGVANFHEAAAICTSVFGRTILGIMTACELYDTKFENNFNKVVEFGMAKVKVDLNENGKFLAASVQYSMTSEEEIVKEDARIVLKNELTTEDISRQCLELSKKFNIPWR